jgi:hypothetical protein
MQKLADSTVRVVMNGHTRRRLSGGLPKLCLALLSLVQPWVVVATGLGFLRNSALGHFEEEDVNLMLKNAGEVLESVSPHANKTWSNPKTGNSGVAEVLDAFTRPDGVLCKRVRVLNKVKRGDIEDQATYTVCKDPDHGWRLNGEVE